MLQWIWGLLKWLWERVYTNNHQFIPNINPAFSYLKTAFQGTPNLDRNNRSGAQELLMELDARQKSSQLTEEDMRLAFAPVVSALPHEDFNNKIAEAILNHAIHIHENKHELCCSEIKIEAASTKLCFIDSAWVGGPSMRYIITYPTLSPSEIQKIAEIYLYHYPNIEAKATRNKLALEAHVVLEQVIPYMRTPEKLPTYIEHPQTFQDLEEKAGFRVK